MSALQTSVKLAWLPMAVHTALVLLGVVIGQYALDMAPLWAKDDVVPLVDTAPAFLQPFLRWDAHWYTGLAAYGYTKENSVQFPLMPFLVRLVAEVTWLPIPTVGVLLANVFGLASILLVARLASEMFTPKQASRAVWIYALFPTSLYLNCFYTEALFICCSVACMLAAKNKTYLWAGVWALLAALTRNLGIGLGVFLVLQGWPLVASSLQPIHQRAKVLVGCTLPVLGLGGFMLYHYHFLGDGLAFIHNQAGWNRHYCLPWDGLVNAIGLIIKQKGALHLGTLYQWVDVATTLWAIIMLGMLGYQAIQKASLRPFWALGAFWLLIPLLSTTGGDPLYSVSRYILVNVPCMLGAVYLPAKLFRGLAVGMGIGLVICMALVSRWWWIA